MKQRLFSCQALLALVTCLLFGQAAQAQTNYTIRGIEVETTAGDGTAARMAGLEEAETTAFKQLLEQLLPADEAAARAAATPAHRISSMVRGYEVQNERVGATSYSATLDVNFDPAQVSAFIRQANQPQAVQGSPDGVLKAPPAGTAPPVAAAAPRTGGNILVLPVWAANQNRPLLWEGDNPWRAAWNQAERSDTQYIRLPIGDQSDRMMMDAEPAMKAPYDRFSVIAERYQSSTVVVAVASTTVVSGVNALQVDLRMLGRDGQRETPPLYYEQEGDETGEQLLTRAAEDIIARQMQAAQQRAAQQQTQQTQQSREPQQATSYAPRSKITVLSRLSRPNEWVQLRRRLQGLAAVEQVDLSAISSQQVDLVVHYRGSPDVLEAQMQEQGVRVKRASGYWVVGF